MRHPGNPVSLTRSSAISLRIKAQKLLVSNDVKLRVSLVLKALLPSFGHGVPRSFRKPCVDRQDRRTSKAFDIAAAATLHF